MTQIPHKTRAQYVAYLRLTLAIESLERIPAGAGRPPFADETMANLRKWQDGMYKRVQDFVESDPAAEEDGDG